MGLCVMRMSEFFLERQEKNEDWNKRENLSLNLFSIGKKNEKYFGLKLQKGFSF